MYPTSVKTNMRKYGPMETGKFNSDIIGIDVDIKLIKKQFEAIKEGINNISKISSRMEEIEAIYERVRSL